MCATTHSETSAPGDEKARFSRKGEGGDQHELDQLVPGIYDELRRLASRQLRSERRDHTLQTTALVNEAYVKLASASNNLIHNREHFLIVASHAMRQILVDSARQRLAKKRGSGAVKVELSDNMAVTEGGLRTAMIVDDALNRLEQLDPRQARIVEMRFFVGLEVAEIADALGLSTRTVTREWKTAQAWLYSELAQNR